MPMYDYYCESCALVFEKMTSAKSSEALKPCPSCGGSCAKKFSPGSGHVFDNNLTHEGLVPQNTGVSSLDVDFDRIVGRDAEARYKVYEEREERRRDVLRHHPEATKRDLSLTSDGDYRVMTSDEKVSTRNTRAFHNLVTGLSNSKERYRYLKKASGN